MMRLNSYHGAADKDSALLLPVMGQQASVTRGWLSKRSSGFSMHHTISHYVCYMFFMHACKWHWQKGLSTQHSRKPPKPCE